MVQVWVHRDLRAFGDWFAVLDRKAPPVVSPASPSDAPALAREVERLARGRVLWPGFEAEFMNARVDRKPKQLVVQLMQSEQGKK